MCGIAGVFDLGNGGSGEALREIAAGMASRLVHRGPDEGGVWHGGQGRVALGHRRLSILDLSPAGSQPMTSSCGRFTLVYNGEVYNHAELRAELTAEGAAWRGHSDTEVLLEAIARWGLARAVQLANGLFAFAVWDDRERTLSLVRDRLGIKPLYYGWIDRQFVLGSELKALVAHPHFHAEIDRQSLALLLQHSYIPAPRTIYQGVWKLPPGCLLTVREGAAAGDAPEVWWSLDQAIEHGRAAPFRGDAEEASVELEKLLSDAVALQRLADVPVGAFLSGGIDSTAVVALMQAQRGGSVRAFTIGFEDPEFDEAPFAERIARHWQIEHIVERVTAAEAQEVIPLLSEMYDEPFADVSQIPTYLVSRLARRHVTVSLSGDGGDELFGGYERYSRAKRIWKQIAWLPAGLRQAAGRLYQDVIHRGLLRRDGRSFRGRVLAAADRRALYLELHRHWERPAEVAIGAGTSELVGPQGTAGSFVEEMMALDAATYLPDCILTKLDRASMAVSLEARVPLLDHRIVEFAWTLPLELKVRAGVGKWPLRRILERHLPTELFERPKRGFGVPIGEWLRGPLRDWAEDLLAEDRLRREGFLQPALVREKWREHLAGRTNWQYLLWDVLMFQSWLEKRHGT
jgi:asparagine synthase (glutamine-hydrolysing)